MDRFKTVNDSLGHHIGDSLLEQVGLRLSDSLRGVDTVARLGGDEFTVTLTELKKKEDASIVADKIITALSRPFQVNEHTIHIGASIGITAYPNDSEDLNAMLKNADMAMYEVKNQGKNAYKFFTPDMRVLANHRMELEKDLYQALHNNELFLKYQPIFNLKTNSFSGVEALLRWVHPKYNKVSPEKIISIAEESDLIFELGEWIVKTACKQMGLWIQQGLTTIQVAINMSTLQFGKKYDSVKLLKEQISAYNLPRNSIHLEITESLMLEDSKLILDTLFELKKLGVKLSVDDFGTGYSSLSYLRRFPVDILKIDRSFINDLYLGSGDDALVKAIIAMAQSLNLTVVAEGVETEEQLNFLKTHHCSHAQGFYFSKPVSADKIYSIFKNSDL